jgi:molybdopterin molybdotransferase
MHFVRVLAEAGERGALHVRSSGGQGSHQLAAMARANALAVLPDGDGVTLGGRVEVILLDEPPTQGWA